MATTGYHSLDALPVLGVGVTYSTAIEPLVWSHPDLFDVIEIEPQTFWIETGDPDQPFRTTPESQHRIADLPGRKLIHSVGTPVGGTVRPDSFQLALLAEMVDTLDSPWFSDHLGFNSTAEYSTAFFLPPRQTHSGVATVATAVSDLQRMLTVPIAVETGVNYLQPRAEEMGDGAFVAAVLDQANCNLLLDLHNIFCNSLNGRQQMDEFLSQIPLDRVVEVHIAGGFEMDGFWLDAHSGAIPEHLYRVAEQIIPQLPNLKAMIFEIFPAFVPSVGLNVVQGQIEQLHELWSLRTPESPSQAKPSAPIQLAVPEAGHKIEASPSEWEQALAALVTGQATAGQIAESLSGDPGIRIVNTLINEFRASMIVTVLRLSSRLCMLALGHHIFRTILQDFWKNYPPEQFAAAEAENFATYISEKQLKVPQLLKVLEFERNVLRTLLDDQARITIFDFDPLPLLRALGEGRLPDEPGKEGLFEIEVTSEGPVSVTGLDLAEVKQAIRFH